MNTPNRLTPAVIDAVGRIHLWFTPSGARTNVSPRIRFRIDDGRELHATFSEAGMWRGSHYAVSAAELEDGVHVVTTWRDDVDGKKLPSSELRFEFRVAKQPLSVSTAPSGTTAARVR